MASEIAYLPVRADNTVEDVNSSDGKVLMECFGILSKQDGFQRCFWGVQKENPEVMMLLVDWDTVEQHLKFAASPQYTPFLQKWTTILTGDPVWYHAHFSPHPATPATIKSSITATEFLTVYFPDSYTEDDKKKFSGDMSTFVDAIEKNGKGLEGTVNGWVKEDINIPGTSDTGKAWVGLLGWSSIEAHMTYRDSQFFKDTVHLLREAKDLKKVTMFHVHFQIYEGSS